MSDNAGVGVHHWGGTRPGTSWPGERATLVKGTQAIFKFDVEESESFIFTRIPGSGTVSD